MAISRIPGYSLLSDLDRQGIDLEFTTNGNTLVYMDFANFRTGINTTTPTQALDINGNLIISNGHSYTTGNLSYDFGSAANRWRSIYVGTIWSANLNGTLITALQPNITTVGNLTALGVNGDVIVQNNIVPGSNSSGSLGIANTLWASIYANVVSANELNGTLLTANQPNITNLANVSLTNLTVANTISTTNLSANIVSATEISGTILTAYQPNITNLGNITVETISIVGNITITGNTIAEIISADEIYEAGYRVLTSNTNIAIIGDATGSGTYNNVAITLINSGVIAGSYGSTDYVPQIGVDNKGRAITLSNVTLTKVGNVTVTDTTLSTTGNISITPLGGYILAGNSVLSNVSDPIETQDVVTKGYLSNTLSLIANTIVAGDSHITITDTGQGQIESVIDGTVISQANALNTNFYTTVNIGNLSITDKTITSTGNIILDAQGTSVVVQIAGNDAVRIPVGDDSNRPTIADLGYIRYNTDHAVIEFFNGNTWTYPGQATISSEIITPDGVANTFLIGTTVTADGLIVNINGTMQRPYVAYTTANSYITFTEVPEASDIIEIRSIAAGGTTVTGLQYGAETSLQLTVGNINVSGNLLPTANVIYNLGSPTNSWKDLYVEETTISGNVTVSGNVKFDGWHIYESSNTLYFAFGGNVKMSLNSNGNLTVSGNVIPSSTP